MLKANGIVPTVVEHKRPAAAQPEVEDAKKGIIEIENDTEEIKALEVCIRPSFETSVVNFSRFIQNRLKTLKSRRSSSNGNPYKRVKREPPNQNFFVPGEVIDLT